MFRAVSWLDMADQTRRFAAFHYACIDARLAIEHLIFEQLAITAGNDLDAEKYERCVDNPQKLDKLLQQFVPDYEKLQEFTKLVGSLSLGVPPVNQWNIKNLRKSWGQLSHYLHWAGDYRRTTENPLWQAQAIQDAKNIIEPLWQKISSGHSGSIRLESMPQPVREIWNEFRDGQIDFESARGRLNLVRDRLRT